MKAIIKWPGGKGEELPLIKGLFPVFERYVEPFFGGGSVFFGIDCDDAIINDISSSLITFYKSVQRGSDEFRCYLEEYNDVFEGLKSGVDARMGEILSFYNEGKDVTDITREVIAPFASSSVVLDADDFDKVMVSSVKDKVKRTKKIEEKEDFNSDVTCNLLTGFTSGFYLYTRKVYNDIHLGNITVSDDFASANYYFIREFCYGAMFRFNSKGTFNIPYGGISYNSKNFKGKIDYLLSEEVKSKLSTADIRNSDFEEVLKETKATDFVFLDPPYDTEFSEYDGNAFGKEEQVRLRDALLKCPAKFMLVIKNTDFIYELYKEHFTIRSFDKKYGCNIKGRFDRNVKHLIITNE